MLPVLNNIQLDDYFGSIHSPYQKMYLGCFAKDELKTMKPQSKFAIVNNANEEKSGTHWVCFYACKNQPHIYFFDSYGMPPAEDILHYMQKISKKTKKSIQISTMEIQPLGTDACGWYCIYVLTHLASGWSMKDILDTFSWHPHLNDRGLYEYFKPAVDHIAHPV